MDRVSHGAALSLGAGFSGSCSANAGGPGPPPAALVASLFSAGRVAEVVTGSSPTSPQTPPVPLPALLPRRGTPRGDPVRPGGAAGAAGRPPGRRRRVPLLFQRSPVPAPRPERQRCRQACVQGPQEGEGRLPAQGPRGEWAPPRKSQPTAHPGSRPGPPTCFTDGEWRPRLPGTQLSAFRRRSGLCPVPGTLCPASHGFSLGWPRLPAAWI